MDAILPWPQCAKWPFPLVALPILSLIWDKDVQYFPVQAVIINIPSPQMDLLHSTHAAVP